MSESRRLVVYTDAQGSGLGWVTRELTDSLRSIGFEITLIAPRQPLEPKASQRFFIFTPGGNGLWRRMTSRIFHILQAGSYVGGCCSDRVPLLMIHLSTPIPITMLPGISARLRGARIFLNLHDFYPHTSRYPKVLRWLERYFYRWSYRRFDQIFALNEAQRQRLIREARVAADRVTIVNHGVFVAPDAERPAARGETTRLLLFGSLRPNKRIRESISAIQDLVSAGVAVSLTIAGAARHEDGMYWTQCRSMVGKGDAIHLLDRFISQEEIPRLLTDCDAMLCPYDNFDSQSGVALLALSNGVPLISTRSGAISAPERLGAAWQEVMSPVTAEGVAAAVKAFIARRETAATVALQNREWISQEYSWSQAAATIADVISRGQS